jgi:hypothetical protein
MSSERLRLDSSGTRLTETTHRVLVDSLRHPTFPSRFSLDVPLKLLTHSRREDERPHVLAGLHQVDVASSTGKVVNKAFLVLDAEWTSGRQSVKAAKRF